MAIARRVTTFPTRRLLRPLPSSTLLYSTIFAAAAVADAKMKDSRRKEWDKAIASAKEELETSKEALQTALDAEGMSEIELENRHWTDVFADQFLNKATDAELADPTWAIDVVMETQYDDEHFLEPLDIESLEVLEWEDVARYNLEIGSRRPPWPANFGPELNINNLPPQSLWGSDRIREKALDRRWTAKKMRMLDTSIACLVTKFVLAAELHSSSPTVVESLPEAVRPFASLKKEELESAVEEALIVINDIRASPDWQEGVRFSTQVPYPYYQQDHHGHFRAIGRRMDDSIYALFERHFTSPQEFPLPNLLASISHELLTSTAAPNVRTYNILLTGLSRLKADELFDNTVESFYTTKVRPNETTCAAILTNYTRRGIADKFLDFIGRMAGTRSGGLMLARPDVNITATGAPRLKVHTSRQEKIIQKVYPTPKVFSVMVGGLLRFFGFEKALETCTVWKEDGWGLDEKGWTKFLRDCVGRGDWTSGLQIWELMQKLGVGEKKSLGRESYATMLALCAACGKEKVFKEVFHDALAAKCRQKELLPIARAVRRIALEEEASRKKEWEAADLKPSASLLKNQAEDISAPATEYMGNDLSATEPITDSSPVGAPATGHEGAREAGPLWHRHVVEGEDGDIVLYEELGEYQEDSAEHSDASLSNNKPPPVDDTAAAGGLANTIAESRAKAPFPSAALDSQGQSTAVPTTNGMLPEQDAQGNGNTRTGAAFEATTVTRYAAPSSKVLPWRRYFLPPRPSNFAEDPDQARSVAVTA